VANGAIAFIEYTYRVSSYSTFLGALPYIIVPILVGQWGLFNGFSQASSLFLAGAVFSLINCIIRVFIVYYIGETLNWLNWLGVFMLVSSAILLKVKI